MLNQSVASGDPAAVTAGIFANCLVNEAKRRVEANTLDENQRLLAYQQALAANGFFKISDLINNQPQAIIMTSYRSRDDNAGGDSFSVKASLEFDLSGHNINNLNKTLKKNGCWTDIQSDVFNYRACADDVGKYVAKNSVKEGGWRLSVNLEYAKTDSLNLAFSNGTMLDQDDSKMVKFGLVAGRQFSLLAGRGLPAAKIDIAANYEDVSGDPMKQDRATANVTFTQQLAKATQLSFGVVWANKPEFRGAAEEDITARIGLNYKIGPLDGS